MCGERYGGTDGENEVEPRQRAYIKDAGSVGRKQGFCPCAVERSEDTKCICKEFRLQLRDKIAGPCRCGLWEAVEDPDELMIKVYQIDTEKDEMNVKFRNYDSVMKVLGRIDPRIYRRVFSGKVKAGNLEQVYALFNEGCPLGHKGHSMSVSDIVELEDGSVHFCDSIGFIMLHAFDVNKTAKEEDR